MGSVRLRREHAGVDSLAGADFDQRRLFCKRKHELPDEADGERK